MGIYVICDDKLPDENYHGRIPLRLFKPIKLKAGGGRSPVVIVTSPEGTRPIMGYKGNTAGGRDGIKKKVRALRKRLKAEPELLAIGTTVTETTKPSADTTSRDTLLAESQEWMNTAGKTITAAIKSADAENVVFVMENGKEVTYPLSKLHLDSRAKITELRLR